MFKFIVVTLSFGFFVNLGPALALECKRKSLDAAGFPSLSSAKSWYPDEIYIENANFERKEGYSKLLGYRYDVQDPTSANNAVMFYLFPNGRLSASVISRSAHQESGQARYKCDLNSIELAKLQNLGEQSDFYTKYAKRPVNTETHEASSSFEIAKSRCSEIGFRVGTEQYGNCVLKMLDKLPS